VNEVIATLVGLAGLAGLLWFYATITDRQDLEIFAERAIMGIGAIVILIIFLSNDGSDSSPSSNVKPKTSGVSSSFQPLSEENRIVNDNYYDCWNGDQRYCD